MYKPQGKTMTTTTAKDMIPDIIGGFQKMIEDAPTETETNQQKTAKRYLFVHNGWGAKYCRRIDLRGAEWHAAFEDAKPIIRSGGFVAMVGERGPGKTQMAAEIARTGEFPNDETIAVSSGSGIVAHAISKTALYRRAMDVFLDLRHAAKNFSNTSEKQVLETLSSVGLLVIDEFQERGESEWENRVIKNLIDKRYAAQRATIVIANMTRKDLFAALGESIVDRARENGKSIEFNWPSFRQPAP